MVWQMDERDPAVSHFLHDNDKKFTGNFDSIFRSEGIEIVPLPHRAPTANAFAERWVRTVREDCLDQLLIWNEAHLRRVLKEYVTYYNTRRPHQGLGQDTPEGLGIVSLEGEIRRRDVSGGIIHDYYRHAA